MTWGSHRDYARQMRERRHRILGCRPTGKRWSEFILGRNKCLSKALKDGEVVVSAYMYEGKMRYTDPVRTRASKAGPGVLYRVRVKCRG